MKRPVLAGLLKRRRQPSPMHFANEAEMRDYFAANLDQIELGMTLYSDRNRYGVEFPCDEGRKGRRGFIDILALDRHGNICVIEVKIKAAAAYTVGQLLGYMGYVNSHLTLDRGTVRGIVIVKQASPMMMHALDMVPHLPVAVFEFQDDGQLKRVR